VADDPTLNEVCAALRADYRDRPANTPEYVRGYPGGKRVRPLEIWIPTLSTWVRADGRSYNGDLGRHYVYPGWLGRLRIRLAVRAWEDETGAFWEGDA
jgi:hypothetical protein